MKLTQIFVSTLFALTGSSLQAGEPILSSTRESTVDLSFFCDRADSYAPIGIMAEHIHHKGEFMVSARSMFMRMNQNYLGSRSVSDLRVQAEGFGIVPRDMDMQMHMFGAMYGLTDNLTLMGMVNLVELSMDHAFGPGLPVGNRFRTRSRGLGDASFGLISRLWEDQDSILTGGLSLMLPTAELNKRDFVPPAGGVRRLPYPMQLGSGSWGISPTLTFKQYLPKWSYGFQATAQILFDDNSEGYRLGNRIEANAWVARPLTENFSTSLRLSYSDWGNIEGSDPLIMGPVPTTRPDLRGGSRLDLFAGLSYAFTDSHARLGLEVGKTLYQDLDGPQLGNDFSAQIGLQYSW